MNLIDSSLSRRQFTRVLGGGLTGIALTDLLMREQLRASSGSTPESNSSDQTWSPPTGKPHLPAKAKNVIWLFMLGGVSHMESFDPKPMLNKYAGKSIGETPYKSYLDSPYLKKNLREFLPGNHKVQPTLFPMQVGYKPRGQSGIEVSDWWPNVGNHVDDLAVVRSLWTTDNDHGAQLQFHTGRHALDGEFPTIGAWIHYGLSSLSDSLPQFVVLGRPIADCCGGIGGHGANYLGPEHSGVHLNVDPKNPLAYAQPFDAAAAKAQASEFALLRRLHNIAAEHDTINPALQARIKSYELAYRMQTAVPEVMKFDAEPNHVQRLYGLDADTTRSFGQQCLAARRLIERGVRFVQVFHGGDGGAGAWDAHGGLKDNHTALCGQVDKPIAGLLADLKQRGMLEETIVVWATEFGRTPGAQGSNGRDHHPFGFCAWLAGGGIKQGVTHGKTDELGFHAVEHRHYVTDIHATIMQQLGLDPRRLEIPGRKRLDLEFGKPIAEIIG